ALLVDRRRPPLDVVEQVAVAEAHLVIAQQLLVGIRSLGSARQPRRRQQTGDPQRRSTPEHGWLSSVRWLGGSSCRRERLPSFSPETWASAAASARPRLAAKR